MFSLFRVFYMDCSRRGLLVVLGTTPATVFTGCLSNDDGSDDNGVGGDGSSSDNDTGTLNGWNIADEEEEAWMNLQAALSTIRAYEQASEEDLQRAQSRLEDADSIYKSLYNQTSDKLDGRIQVSFQAYCSRLRAAIIVGQSAVTVILNGANPEVILDTLNSQIEEAESIYNDTDEIQDATRDKQF